MHHRRKDVKDVKQGHGVRGRRRASVGDAAFANKAVPLGYETNTVPLAYPAQEGRVQGPGALLFSLRLGGDRAFVQRKGVPETVADLPLNGACHTGNLRESRL